MHDEYTAPRVVVSAAGNITHEYLVEQIEKALVSLKKRGGRKKTPVSYVGGEYRENKKIEQVNLILGFDALPYGHPLYYSQNILATILGGGMSSRLFQEIREKRGWFILYTRLLLPIKTAVISVFLPERVKSKWPNCYRLFVMRY